MTAQQIVYGVLQVQSLVKKVANYHLTASSEERDERDHSFFANETLSCDGLSESALPPPLRKQDVSVLARQLQVTRTEIGAAPLYIKEATSRLT